MVEQCRTGRVVVSTFSAAFSLARPRSGPSRSFRLEGGR